MSDTPGKVSAESIAKRDIEVYKYNRTHLWVGGGEMWKCKRCGESKIELGFWGDDNWRKTHQGWKVPCPAFTKFWSKFDFPKEF
jgi:hypothetical protein